MGRWLGCVVLLTALTVAEGYGRRGQEPAPFSFVNVAREAGLHDQIVFGGAASNKYLLETTGTGVAFIDYDNDGLIDLFFVNGSTLEGFPPGKAPINHLYRNKGDGTFEDVTSKAGLAASGWGQGACVGDVDNDGRDDLFVTYWGQNHLYHNTGGRFEDVTKAAGLEQSRVRWNTGCAFFDYDRDGRLDLLVANYIDLDLATAPTPESGLCRYKGLQVACGPPGLTGGKNLLYHNRGDGTFEDVSEKSGITHASGTYGLGVSTFDFDNDGWVDVYVANDSNPSAVYRNNHDGTFTDVGVKAGCAYSQDGKPQAGMGVAIGDYDRNGTMDIFKTNFAGDTSTLYANSGEGLCDDHTFAAGIGMNTRWLGWGTGFVDFDNDGWLDLFLTNGHVYPEVRQLKTEAGYAQRKVVYRNLGNGRFADISEQLGPPVTTPKAGRGAAFGDFDNDGQIDVAIANVNDQPDLYRLKGDPRNHWVTLKLVGSTSNRNAIGARVRLVTGDVQQWQEVRGGGSYLSQNDFRVHFGLGAATRVDRVDVRWPNGAEQTWENLEVDKFHTLTEGNASKTGGNATKQGDSSTSSQEKGPASPQDVRQQALSQYLSGHIAEAIPFLEQTLKTSPDDSQVSYALATAYAQTRQPDKARATIARTFRVTSDSAAAHLLTGQMMNRLELEDLAEAELKAVVQMDPKMPEAHYLLGQIAIFRSRFDEGLALMREELALNPAHAMALYRIGDIFARQAKWTEAIDALQRSIWMNPYFSGPYILLGKAFSKTGRVGEAEDMLKQAVSVDPNNKSAHYLLAQILQQAGKPDEAKREFAIAERLQGDSK
jgi:tetratricopeptide (TPR) repeat protein